MHNYKVFITGGHLTPALAVIQKIRDEKYPISVVFVGRKYAMEGDSVPSEEFRIIQTLHIPFLVLTTGRFRRFFSVGSITSLLKIPIGFISAYIYCLREKPDLIISFGGYIALPVVLAGWFLRIPAITHEQTQTVGLANRVIAVFAKKICISWPESVPRSPGSKWVYTGLPLRKEIFFPPPKPSFTVDSELPLLYILGGVTGSETINILIRPIVARLVDSFTVIHQTGSNWIDNGRMIRESISGEKRNRYIPMPYVDSPDHSWALHTAKLVVSRAGANTVAELAVLGIPAVLLPLDWSGGEQAANALYLERTGLGVTLKADQVTSEDLFQAIIKANNENKYRKPQSVAPMVDGTQNFLHEAIMMLEGAS